VEQEPPGRCRGVDALWFPQLSDPGARAATWPLIAPHHDRIKGWLDADVTVATIAQRLRDDHGVAASESSVRRWVATHFADEMARERVTVPRGEVDPGSEAQIDYGWLGMWLDPATAKRVAVWAFVMVLSCSRHLFVRPVIRMDQTTWCACHVASVHLDVHRSAAADALDPSRARAEDSGISVVGSHFRHDDVGIAQFSAVGAVGPRGSDKRRHHPAVAVAYGTPTRCRSTSWRCCSI
jgi:hypothetical protein